MRTLLALALLLHPLVGAAPEHTPQPSQDGFGILVMAHGGNEEWDRTVRDALTPLESEMPVALAFGMADATTIEEAVRSLEARGVDRIGVVRLFISGDSWLQRTEQILGLAAGAPDRPADALAGDCEDRRGNRGSDCHDTGHRAAFYRIPTSARLAVSREGLNEAPEADRILLERARDLSEDPSSEDVVILAHGVGDPDGNAVWRERIEARAALLRAEIPFRRVHVETLAEDWPEARAAAEERVRTFVGRASADGRAIVIPFRLSGFGPYDDVLEDLDYVADGRGLLPHPAVTDWIRRQAGQLRVELATAQES